MSETLDASTLLIALGTTLVTLSAPDKFLVEDGYESLMVVLWTAWQELPGEIRTKVVEFITRELDYEIVGYVEGLLL